MMVVFYLLGWLFLAGAFIAAAAETVAHGQPGVDAMFLSAHELWSALSPKGLVIARYMVERGLSAAAWDPLLVNLMALPAWLILGAPGAALVWLSRPAGKRRSAEDDDLEESLFLFDALVEEARKAGHVDDLPEEEEMTRNYETEGLTTNFAAAEDPEEWDPPGAGETEPESDRADFMTSPPPAVETDGNDGNEDR